MTITRKFFWVPVRDGYKTVTIDFPFSEPTSVATVMSHDQFNTDTGEHIRHVNTYDKDVEPILHDVLMHHVNVFLEDKVHDWSIHGRRLHYGSRVSNGGHWIVAIWDDSDNFHPRSFK